MKNFFAKAIIIVMMVAFAPIGAGAQNINTTVSISDTEATKAYLTANPLDTIVNGQKKAFLVNGEVVCTGFSVSEPALKAIEKKPAQSVERHGDTTSATYADGTSSTFTRTTSGRVSYSDKVAVVNGRKFAVRPGNRDIEGNLRHTVYMSLLGGAMYVVDDHEFQPLLNLKGGYESCHFLFEIEAQGTWMQYTDSASVAGHHYSSLSFYVGAGWKVWQDARYRNYVALGGSLGYAYQRTDDKNADVFSDNYGLAGKAWVRGILPLGLHLGLLMEAGYNLLPKVYHKADQNHQDLNHGGGYVQIGLNYRFNR